MSKNGLIKGIINGIVVGALFLIAVPVAFGQSYSSASSNSGQSQSSQSSSSSSSSASASASASVSSSVSVSQSSEVDVDVDSDDDGDKDEEKNHGDKNYKGKKYHKTVVIKKRLPATGSNSVALALLAGTSLILALAGVKKYSDSVKVK